MHSYWNTTLGLVQLRESLRLQKQSRLAICQRSIDKSMIIAQQAQYSSWLLGNKVFGKQ